MYSIARTYCHAVPALAADILIYHCYVILDADSLLSAVSDTSAAPDTFTAVNVEQSLPTSRIFLGNVCPNLFHPSQSQELAKALFPLCYKRGKAGEARLS